MDRAEAARNVKRSQGLATLAQQGFTQEVLGIEVTNTGRLAIQVAGVKAALSNGVKVSSLAGSLGPALPYRLEPQHTESWFLPAPPIRGAVVAAVSIGKGTDLTVRSPDARAGRTD